MNKTIFSSSLIQSLKEQGLIMPCSQRKLQVQKELQSLERCKRRSGYLGIYDTAIRYTSLLLLATGHTMDNTKVHSVLEQIIPHLACSDMVYGKGVIRARHRLKYEDVRPGDTELLDLLDIHAELKNVFEKIDLDYPITNSKH